MASEPYACPHCGEIDWSRLPRLADVLKYVTAHPRTTTRDVADTLGISVQNAHNRMRTLCAMGRVQEIEMRPAPGGGREGIFSAAAPEPAGEGRA